MPVLESLSERASMHTDSVFDAVGRRIQVDPSDLAQTKLDGEPLLRSRVWHTLDQLRQEGLVTKPENAWWKITSAGQAFLRESRS